MKTAAQDTVTGAVLGSAGGAVGGNVEKVARGNELRKIDSIEGFNQSQIKNLRKYATNYYDDYIQGTSVKRNDMEKIQFGNTGIKEVKSRSLHNAKMLPDLKKQIQSGIKRPSKYDYERNDISNFEIIENSKGGKIYEYQIANDNANGSKFYTVKDITKMDSSSTDWNQHPGSKKSPNNIISSSQTNLNPQSNKSMSYEKWLAEQKKKRRKLGWW